MLERTIAISARHMASPEVEKLFITVKCPESLLPSHRQLVQFLEMNIRKWVRTEGIRDYGQEEYDGPAPDNKSLEAEKAERDAARNERVEEERRVNREANKLPDRGPITPRVVKGSVPAIAAVSPNDTPREAAGEQPSAWARRKLAAMDKAKAPKKK